MRSIDATLTAALAAGTGKPILTGYIGYSNGNVTHSQDITQYKLTGTTLEFEMPYTADVVGDQTHVWLKRGLSIAGVDYTLTTSRFAIQSQHYLPNGRQLIKATLFPKKFYSASGYATYQTVINAFCTAFGKTAVFRDPAAAWLNYTFLPLGTSIVLEDANDFAAMLRQKYLIFMADRGSEEILFYSCAAGLFAPPVDFNISAVADFFIENPKNKSRRFVWRDELGAVHSSGVATNPAHNLGFLWSTDSAPAMTDGPAFWQLIKRPDLRILDGDLIQVSAFNCLSKGWALITEEYTAPDKAHPVRAAAAAASPGRDGPHPRWTTTITSNEVFGNTSGGSAPTSIVQIANYYPLNTSAFDGLLSPTESNIQTALDRLDNHSHCIPETTNLLNQTVPAATTYHWPPGTSYFGATAFNAIFPAGKIKNLRIWINSAQPAGGSLVITVYVNVVATSIVITIPAGSAAGGYTDLTNIATVAAGQSVRIVIQNNAPAAPSAQIAALSFEFFPDP